jgi:O-antigen ligase
MTNIVCGTFPRQVARTTPAVWRTLKAWLVLLPLLWLAGASWGSSQDAIPGDMIVATDPGHFATRAAWIFSYGLIAAVAFSSWETIYRVLTNNSWLILTCALALLSATWSQDPLQSIKWGTFLCLSTFVAAWFAGSLRSEQQMEILMITGTVAALLSMGVALFVPKVGLDRVELTPTWQGIFYSKNHCGRIMLFLLTPAFYYRWKRALSATLYISALTIVIFMSRSKTAAVLTLVYVVFFLTVKLAKKVTLRSRVLLGLVLMGSAITALTMTNSILHALSSMGFDTTLSGRTVIWSALMQSAMKHPMLGYGYHAFWTGASGEGFNAFLTVFGTIHFAGSYSHSGYFDVLLQLGIVGLVILAIGIFKATKNGIICLTKRCPSSAEWYIGIVVLSVLYNVDEVTFLLPSYLPWIMFLFAYIGLAAEAKRVQSLPAPQTTVRLTTNVPVLSAVQGARISS